jgi:hypothetical protein
LTSQPRAPAWLLQAFAWLFWPWMPWAWLTPLPGSDCPGPGCHAPPCQCAVGHAGLQGWQDHTHLSADRTGGCHQRCVDRSDLAAVVQACLHALDMHACWAQATSRVGCALITLNSLQAAPPSGAWTRARIWPLSARTLVGVAAQEVAMRLVSD